MNKVFHLLLLAMAVLGFSSCQKWLDIPSPTQLDNQTVFQNLEAANMAVLGVYSSSFHQELYLHLTAHTDEAMSTENNNSKTRLANYDYVPAESPLSFYTVMYRGIELSNGILKRLPDYTPANEAEERRKNMLLGEAYALRAMCYLNVVRFFGDMPYTDIPFEDADSFAAGRTDRDYIYDRCVEDLQLAIELLPWRSEGMIISPERFSKNAAYGILARVCLYAAGYSLRWDLGTYSPSSRRLAKRSDATRIRELYQIASDACAAVIARGENSLVPSYENVFRDLANGRFNSESMLEFGQYGTNFNGTGLGYTNGTPVLRGNVPFGRVFPLQGAMPTLWFDYDEDDTRRGVTVANYGLDDQSRRLLQPYSMGAIGKWRAAWSADKGFADNRRNMNWIWLRYPDILLMYAEAQNELNNGPTTVAIDALRDVRLRAFAGDNSKIGTIPNDYQGFLDAIIEERKLELAFEGWRRTDLVRWGIMFEQQTETKNKLIALARREGRYANVPRFAAYQGGTAVYSDPVVEVVPAYTYLTEPDVTEKARLATEGYTLINMNGDAISTGATRFDLIDPSSGQLPVWISGMFSGMIKEHSELLPLGSGKIDTNPGLAGQELPGY